MDENNTTVCPICKHVIMSDEMDGPEVCGHVIGWYNYTAGDWAYVNPEVERLVDKVADQLSLSTDEAIIRIYGPDADIIVQHYRGQYLGGDIYVEELFIYIPQENS